MTPTTFVLQVRRRIVDRNLAQYVELLASVQPDEAKDPYWKRTLELYQSLDEVNKSALRDLIRQTIVDTVSSVFAALDGVSQLDDQPEQFVLTTKSQLQPLNGDLQDLFLEAEEKARSS